MIVGVPRAINPNENRVALVPAGAEARAGMALSNATFPDARKLAALGWKAACRDAAALRAGLDVVVGKTVYPAVAEAFGLPPAAAETVL